MPFRLVLLLLILDQILLSSSRLKAIDNLSEVL